MTLRHRKRGRRKYMGSRNWGGGNTKNRRGKGSIGGAGLGGGHKNKWTWMVRYEPKHFGRQARRTRFAKAPKVVFDYINVGEINGRIERNLLKKEGDKYAFAFEGKVLGGGTINHPIVVRAECFSASAQEKIKKAGGEAIARMPPHEAKAQKAEKKA